MMISSPDRPVETTKDFAPILDDYAFFEVNSTEAREDLRNYLPSLLPLAESGRPIHVLDFGCGSGNFSTLLHETVGFPSHLLHLTLVEPEAASRRQAAERIAGFTRHPIETWAALEGEIEDRFDVVIANHSLYYVPDLSATVRSLLRSLRPGGCLLTAMAGHENQLVQFWHTAFARMNRAVPYHTADDLERVLIELGHSFHRQETHYELSFADSEENRLAILRFLFSDHLARMPRSEWLALLDPLARDGRIEIHTSCGNYRMDRPAVAATVAGRIAEEMPLPMS